MAEVWVQSVMMALGVMVSYEEIFIHQILT